MGLLWPSKSNPDPTTLARLGRVLHWTGAIVAVLFLVLGFFVLRQATEDSEIKEIGAALVSGAAAAAYFAGRGLRYVLADE
jgi:hypothetical protein